MCWLPQNAATGVRHQRRVGTRGERVATATDSFIVVGLLRAAEAWCCKGHGAPLAWCQTPAGGGDWRRRLETQADASHAGGHVRSDQ